MYKYIYIYVCAVLCIYLILKNIFLPDSGRQGGRFCQSLAKSPTATSVLICRLFVCFYIFVVVLIFIQGRFCQSLPKWVLLEVVYGPDLPITGKNHHLRESSFASLWQNRLVQGEQFCQWLAKSSFICMICLYFSILFLIFMLLLFLLS